MTADLTPATRQAMIEGTPLKRIGRADEIAEMVLFLLSERAAFTTGQTFIASGGRVTLP
jgi:NAD(P)-dependent dehydrogenase (short-subunit alcohol dehydrogenase family)